MKEGTGHHFEVHLENYLKAIWNLSQLNNRALVRNSELAAALGVSRPTVTESLRKLVKAKLLREYPRGAVELSAAGRKKVVLVLRRHRLVELFLHRVLGLGPAEIHREAELLEHAISSTLLERMEAFLEHPRSDLMGMPIPPKAIPQNFSDERRGEKRLLDLLPGDAAQIVSVADYDEGLQESVLRSGLRVGQKIQMEVARDPDHVQVADSSGERFTLERPAARLVRVRRA